MATTTKGIRLAPSELARVQYLRASYPETTTEAELIKLATVRGLMLLESEVAASGGGLPTGVTEADLASVILPRILPTVLWLARMGRLDLAGVTSSVPSRHTPDRRDDEPGDLDLGAAQDISDLGSDFL